MNEGGSVVLRMLGITKEFPGVRALSNVDFELRKGEIHVIVGENGAGKSTLMKVLGGVHPPDSGRIILRGHETSVRNPRDAQRLGIALIHQELNLIPYLSVAQNIYLGREPLSRRFMEMVDYKTLRRKTVEVLDRINLKIDPAAPVVSFGIAHRQMIEIAKALSLEADIIVMDEPTSSLSRSEVEELFRLITDLKARGVSIVYISHRLEEIRMIGDRVTVLRDGAKIATLDVKGLDLDTLIRLMVGRDLKEKFPGRVHRLGDEILKVERLSSRRGGLRNISLSVRKGEILGIAGLVGSGRTELARAVFGADPPDTGKVYVEGKEVKISSPSDAVRAGIGLLPEDRKNEGLVLSMPIRENVTLPVMEGVLSKGVLVNRATQAKMANEYANLLRIKAPSIMHLVRMLSGGNQQKVVVAKWLCAQAKVLIFDEPTRGIDVGAKVEVYRIMNELAEGGRGILLISSELPEILGMCDKIMVMRRGSVAGELLRDEASQEGIMACATGV